MKQKYYAGIGARSTPRHICDIMTRLATVLEEKGLVLRLGHADGADLAFEKGVLDPRNKEIYIPWSGFNGSPSTLFHISEEAYAMAEKFHPAWHNCKDGAKKLHARNCSQILGEDLNTPVRFVACWTEGGLGGGGTGQALRIARHLDIPIFDLGRQGVLDQLEEKYGIVKCLKAM